MSIHSRFDGAVSQAEAEDDECLKEEEERLPEEEWPAVGSNVVSPLSNGFMSEGEYRGGGIDVDELSSRIRCRGRADGFDFDDEEDGMKRDMTETARLLAGLGRKKERLIVGLSERDGRGENKTGW
jgi:hypothetical protein